MIHFRRLHLAQPTAIIYRLRIFLKEGAPIDRALSPPPPPQTASIVELKSEQSQVGIALALDREQRARIPLHGLRFNRRLVVMER